MRDKSEMIEVEFLNHLPELEEKRLDYLASEYFKDYHTEQPHQGLGEPAELGELSPSGDGRVICHTRLGGLLRHFDRAAT